MPHSLFVPSDCCGARHRTGSNNDITTRHKISDCSISMMMQVSMLLRLLLLSAVALRRAQSWNVDERCLRPRQLDSMQMEEPWVVESEVTNEIMPKDETVRYLRQRELQSSFRFKFKMHWKPGYCWQEEWNERFWCMQCEGSSCSEGDVLEIRTCKQGVAAQQFTWIPTKGGGRIKVANMDLCLERINTNEFELRNCSTSLLQVLVGFKPNGPFEISSFGNVGKKCLTQDHHPKPYEELFTTACEKPRMTNTSLWEAYQSTGTYDPTPSSFTKWLVNRNSTCLPSKPCPECTGNCAQDTDCVGTLKCHKRTSSKPLAPIPGCLGKGLALWGYCANTSPSAAPAAVTGGPTVSPAAASRAPTAAMKRLALPVGKCTVDNPCDECQGDCSYDLDCKGDLVCFQKDGDVPIPGCVGKDVSKTDWCVNPKFL